MRVALQGEQPQAKGAAEGERESCATRAGDVFAFGQLLRWLRGTQATAEEVAQVRTSTGHSSTVRCSGSD